MKNICKNCEHWKSEQAELNYSTFKGICTCFKWKFETNNDGDICILDRSDLSGTIDHTYRFESQSNKVPFGNKESSNYCFVTDEKFGCINFNKR